MSGERPEFVIAKMMEEGTSSAFVARIVMTPPALRNMVLSQSQIAPFDEIYHFILTHLIELRTEKRELDNLWGTHAARVQSGDAAHFDRVVRLREPIDQPLSSLTRKLIMDAARVVRKMQELTRVFGIDIGFLFQKTAAFERGLQALYHTDLAAYLRESRDWLEQLQRERTKREHDTFVPDRLRYEVGTDQKLSVVEPLIGSLPLTQFFRKLLSRVNRLVEEVTICCIQQSLPKQLIIAEIARSSRDPNKVERFKITVDGFGDRNWSITFSDEDFEAV